MAALNSLYAFYLCLSLSTVFLLKLINIIFTPVLSHFLTLTPAATPGLPHPLTLLMHVLLWTIKCLKCYIPSPVTSVSHLPFSGHLNTAPSIFSASFSLLSLILLSSPSTVPTGFSWPAVTHHSPHSRSPSADWYASRLFLIERAHCWSWGD